MSGSVELIDPNAMIRDAAIRMRDQDLGAIPVAENDRLIGMVTTAVREVMAERICYCFEEDFWTRRPARWRSTRWAACRC
jgi:CBS domain-containing protein